MINLYFALGCTAFAALGGLIIGYLIGYSTGFDEGRLTGQCQATRSELYWWQKNVTPWRD